MQSLISKQTENVFKLYKSLFRGFNKKVNLFVYWIFIYFIAEPEKFRARTSDDYFVFMVTGVINYFINLKLTK